MADRVAKVTDEITPMTDIPAAIARLVQRSRQIATQEGIAVHPRTRVYIVAETEFEDGKVNGS